MTMGPDELPRHLKKDMNDPFVAPVALKRPLPEAFGAALALRFGARFTTAQSVRDHHGRDESPFDPVSPDAVVYAQCTEDVSFVVALCNQFEVPVIAYGSGSSLEGTFWPSVEGSAWTCRR